MNFPDMVDMAFVAVLVINTLISIVYLIWNVGHAAIKKTDDGKDSQAAYVLKTLVMLMCPIVGPMFFFVGEILHRIFFRQNVDLEDVIFSKDRVKVNERADTEREGNIVPIEEALAISDKESLRNLVMNVVRGNVHNSLASISLALNSEDTETAHYAASVLRDELNDFRQRSQELYNLMNSGDGRSLEYASELIEYMNGILAQNVFHDMEQKTYVDMMEDAVEFIYAGDKEKLTAEYLEWVCLRLLNIKEYERMEKWCIRSMELYPNELSTYTCRLKLYFTVGDRTKFFEALDQLKASNVVIDKETLELIRIFS